MMIISFNARRDRQVISGLAKQLCGVADNLNNPIPFHYLCLVTGMIILGNALC